jgi:hypothetical protein
MDVDEYAANGWLVLDTTELTADATVEAIMTWTRG